MTHHLSFTLPSGNEVLVDYRAAIVPLIRRVNMAKLNNREPDERDLAQIYAWFEENPSQLCTTDDMVKGETCGGKHLPSAAPATAAAWVSLT